MSGSMVQHPPHPFSESISSGSVDSSSVSVTDLVNFQYSSYDSMRSQQRAALSGSSFASSFYASSLSNSFNSSSTSTHSRSSHRKSNMSLSTPSASSTSFNKQNWLATSFRFLLDSVSFSWLSTQRALAEPDQFIDWAAVRLVLMPTLPGSEDAPCAICLERPIAPYADDKLK
jgi:hypothetical protein